MSKHSFSLVSLKKDNKKIKEERKKRKKAVISVHLTLLVTT